MNTAQRRGRNRCPGRVGLWERPGLLWLLVCRKQSFAPSPNLVGSGVVLGGVAGKGPWPEEGLRASAWVMDAAGEVRARDWAQKKGSPRTSDGRKGGDPVHV